MNRRSALLGAGAVAVGAAGYLQWRSMGSMADYTAGVTAARRPLSLQPAALELLRYATLAGSGHNAQPWRFDVSERQIAIIPDLARRTPIVDPDDHHLFVSLGCVAETLAIAAGARGQPGQITFDPNGGRRVLFTFGGAPTDEPALFDAIPRRQSCRAEYDGRSVATDALQQLTSAAALPGVELILLTEPAMIDRLRDLVVAGNTAQMTDPAFLRELKTWLRFSPRRAAETGDGLFSAASDHPTAPDWLGPLMFDLAVSAESEADRYALQLRSSSGIAVFIGQHADPAHWVQVGRACQRFALQATALGLSQAHINQPVEVPGLRPELASLVGATGRRPDIVMRFGYGPTLPFSARRPIGSVLA
ncbi:MAG: Tat pathway signal protein [Alphaproteobacteria bacterium]|nr:MAG: Tat pathway signal protein [Alphaproteobacteria bacterium]